MSTENTEQTRNLDSIMDELANENKRFYGEFMPEDPKQRAIMHSRIQSLHQYLNETAGEFGKSIELSDNQTWTVYSNWILGDNHQEKFTSNDFSGMEAVKKLIQYLDKIVEQNSQIANHLKLLGWPSLNSVHQSLKESVTSPKGYIIAKFVLAPDKQTLLLISKPANSTATITHLTPNEADQIPFYASVRKQLMAQIIP